MIERWWRWVKEGSVRDYHCHLTCGECKHFCVRAADENHAETCIKTDHCRRIDHQGIRFYRPWFRVQDCGQHNSLVCADFEPADWCVWLKQHWRGWEDYWGADVIAAVKRDNYSSIPLTLRSDDYKWCYHVHLWDWWYNDFKDSNGGLKWFERWRSPKQGWRTIWERKSEK